MRKDEDPWEALPEDAKEILAEVIELIDQGQPLAPQMQQALAKADWLGRYG